MEKQNTALPSVVVLVPMYRPRLTAAERVSLRSVRRYLGAYPIVLLVPDTLAIEDADCAGLALLRMPAAYFQGFDGYNRLMLAAELYERLADYTFCLVVQLDVLLLRDGLAPFLTEPYDYIGALDEYPLPENEALAKANHCLNGGFSLRRVAAFHYVLEQHPELVGWWQGNEDEFFTWLGEHYPDELRLPSRQVALAFARNRFLRAYDREAGGTLSLGIHGFTAYDPACVYQYWQRAVQGKSAEDTETAAVLQQAMAQQVERQQALCTFLAVPGPLYLYGAGAWGQVAAAYLQAKHIPVTAFVVADDRWQPVQVHGLPVQPVSSLQTAPAPVRILFCLSLRYREETWQDYLPAFLQQPDRATVWALSPADYNGMGDALRCQRMG